MTERNARMMTREAAMMPPQVMAVEGDEETLETRFGKVVIFRKNPIIFPNGLLGLPDKFEFCLTTFPSEKLARFKLLQSLDDKDLSFITLPVDVDNPIMEKRDIETGCRDLGMSMDELTMLMIVTVHRRPDTSVQLSVNARAPIFVDTRRRIATQYVFHNNKYQIQHIITL